MDINLEKKEAVNMSGKRYIRNIMPDVDARVWTSYRDDGSITVYGYAVHAATGTRIDNANNHQHKASSEATIHETELYVVTAIKKELPARRTGPSATVRVSDHGGVFSAIFAACDPASLCKPNWADSTRDDAFTYFERRVLPLMDAIGIDICDADLKEITEALVAKALQSGKSNHDPAQAERSVGKYLRQANYIYCAMRQQYPELPEVEFVATPRSVVLPEQAKSIPNATRVKLAALLCRLAEKSGAALGVAMMLLCGLRTAEAAAVRIGDIIMRDRYVVYPVLYQYMKGDRVPTLKTPAGYRVVVGPCLLKHLLQLRIRFLTALGHSDEEIHQMPLVAKDDDPHAYLGDNPLSARGRALLLSAGYTTDAFLAAEALQMVEPDLDETGKATRDVVAYILRRDWCSRACNVCGLDGDTVDYLMGHAREHGTSGPDYISVETQEKIAKDLENYVFLPDHSQNPAFSPIAVTEGPGGDLSGCPMSILKNDTTALLRISLDLHSREPGQVITAAAAGVPTASQKRGILDSPEHRQCRVPIGKVFPQSYYDELEKQANVIALDGLKGGP